MDDAHIFQHIDDRLGAYERAVERGLAEKQAELDRRFATILREQQFHNAYFERLIEEKQLQADQRYSASKETIADAFQCAKEAVEKAERATEKRFDAVNEFRSQLSDQAATFLPREVAEATFAELRKLISTNTEALQNSLLPLRSADDREAGMRKSSAEIYTRLVAIAGLIASAGLLIFTAIHG